MNKSAKKRKRLYKSLEGKPIRKPAPIKVRAGPEKQYAYELIYAPEAEAIIASAYPNAQFKDASDDIHPGRFEVTIKGLHQKAFWKFAVEQGFALDCLGFELKRRSDREFGKEIIGWIEAIPVDKKE